MILEYNFFPFLKKHTDAMNSKMPKNKKGERCQKFPLYKLQMHTYLPKTKRSCDASEKLFKPEGYEMEFSKILRLCYSIRDNFCSLYVLETLLSIPSCYQNSLILSVLSWCQ